MTKATSSVLKHTLQRQLACASTWSAVKAVSDLIWTAELTPADRLAAWAHVARAQTRLTGSSWSDQPSVTHSPKSLREMAGFW